MDILFDLDGTISDPFIGITSSINYALEKMGEATVSAEQLHRFIGPPLDYTFEILLNSHEQHLILKAIAYFRERYIRIGYKENILYTGMEKILSELAEVNHLHLATYKRKDIATSVLAHFGIDKLFTSINGCGIGKNKSQLIAEIITNHRIDVANAYMVGDTVGDVQASRANGIKAIFAKWGYGSKEDLMGYTPHAVAKTPANLVRLMSA